MGANVGNMNEWVGVVRLDVTPFKRHLFFKKKKQSYPKPLYEKNNKLKKKKKK